LPLIETQAMASDSQIRAMLAICTVIFIAAALYFTRPLFAPLSFAVFILAIVWPFAKALQKWLPKVIALFLTLSVTILAVVAFASVIAWALSAIADWLLNNVQRFQSHYAQLTQWLEEHDIFVAGILAERFNVMWLLRLFQEIAARLNRLAGFAILIFIFLMIGLLEIDGLRQRIATLDNARGAELIQAGSEIASKFRRYILVRTLLSVLTGLAIWGFALLSGLEPAAAWGLLAFALNYIPFIGPFVATMLPGLFAMAQLDSWQAIILVFVGLTVIQFLIGNYLEPLVAGAALTISPFAVVFAVFFWTFLWGIPGAFIGVPIMITIITLCAQYPSTRWVATLLGKPRDEGPNGT
jgi:AI-2 transport protein TqsA